MNKKATATKSDVRRILTFAGLGSFLFFCLFAAMQYSVAYSLNAYSDATTRGVVASGAPGSAANLDGPDINAVLNSIVSLPTETNFLGVPVGADEQAANLYMKAYWLSMSRSRDYQSKGTLCQKHADEMLTPFDFTTCIHVLHQRSDFCDLVLRLPYLAEALQRCAVWQCRSRCQKMPSPQTLGLLAQSVKQLADLYSRHEKLEIAARAYADAVEQARIAGSPELGHYYLVWAGFYADLNQEDSALRVIERYLSLRQDRQ